MTPLHPSLLLDIQTETPATDPLARKAQYQAANEDIKLCLKKVKEAGQAHTAWVWHRGLYFKFVDQGNLWREGDYKSLDEWSFAEHGIHEPQVRRYIWVSDRTQLEEVQPYEYLLAGLLEAGLTPKVLRPALGQASSLGASARRLGIARVRATLRLMEGDPESDTPEERTQRETEAQELLLKLALQEEEPVKPPGSKPPSANIKARQVVRAFYGFVNALSALAICPGKLDKGRQEELLLMQAELPGLLEEVERVVAPRVGSGNGAAVSTAAGGGAAAVTVQTPQAGANAAAQGTAGTSGAAPSAGPVPSPAPSPVPSPAGGGSERRGQPRGQHTGGPAPTAGPQPARRGKEPRKSATELRAEKLLHEVLATHCQRTQPGPRDDSQQKAAPQPKPRIPEVIKDAMRKQGIDPDTVGIDSEPPASGAAPTSGAAPAPAPQKSEAERVDEHLDTLGMSEFKGVGLSLKYFEGDEEEAINAYERTMELCRRVQAGERPFDEEWERIQEKNRQKAAAQAQSQGTPPVTNDEAPQIKESE